MDSWFLEANFILDRKLPSGTGIRPHIQPSGDELSQYGALPLGSIYLDLTLEFLLLNTSQDSECMITVSTIKLVVALSV